MKKIYFFSLIVFFVSIASCVYMPDKTDWDKRLIEIKQEYIEMLTPQSNRLIEKGYPLIIRTIFSYKPDSAGGVDARVIFYNISGKEIKYTRFLVIPYNRVNDVVRCEIRNKTLATLEKIGPNPSGLEIEICADYGSVWYNSTIDHITLEGIEIDYMDGTKAVYNKEQANEMIYKK